MGSGQKLYSLFVGKFFLFKVLLLTGACFLTGCSVDSPEIISLEQNTEFIRDLEGNISSSLNFSLLVNDAQGKDDILTIDVYGPESLFWDFSFKALVFEDAEKSAEQFTIHIPKMAAPPGELILPSGKYTVVIHDISSESAAAEYRFNGISSIDEVTEVFPDIRFTSSDKGTRQAENSEVRRAETLHTSAIVSSVPAALTLTDNEGEIMESAEIETRNFDIDFNSLNTVSMILSKVKMGDRLFLSSENGDYGYVFTQEIDVRRILELY
ncbi:MAG: hypothetical protein K9K80_02470 [Spirochaetia bacterium]|nr:hypothetical protein [Spirochaetia bacterium]MCF7953366.1 hypothetical protein [Spirochaetales bacterium]